MGSILSALREICAKASRHVFGIFLPRALMSIAALASMDLTIEVCNPSILRKCRMILNFAFKRDDMTLIDFVLTLYFVVLVTFCGSSHIALWLCKRAWQLQTVSYSGTVKKGVAGKRSCCATVC
jgi:hypothetical protein